MSMPHGFTIHPAFGKIPIGPRPDISACPSCPSCRLPSAALLHVEIGVAEDGSPEPRPELADICTDCLASLRRTRRWLGRHVASVEV